MKKITKCKSCGKAGHATEKSKSCSHNSDRKLRRVYTYMLLLIMMSVLWLAKQSLVDPINQNNTDAYETSHETTYEIINSDSEVSSSALVEHMQNAYMKQITRSRLSVDITVTISFIAILFLFKAYITNLIVLQNEVAQLRADLQDGIKDKHQGIICDDTPSTSTITT
jgi:hypothetical protein